jgi:hypothetical protein
MDLIVLVCVVSAALAAGVLGAYGVCLGMFAAFRMHAGQVRAGKVNVALVNASTVTAIGS